MSPPSHRAPGTQGGLALGGEWPEIGKRVEPEGPAPAACSNEPVTQAQLLLPPGRLAVKESPNEDYAKQLSEPLLCCRTELLLKASNSRS